jgi:hypothetical protein
MAAATKLSTESMTGSFAQLSTATAAGTAQMTTLFRSIPAEAQIIPPAIQKVAVATEEGTTVMGGLWARLANTAAFVVAECQPS